MFTFLLAVTEVYVYLVLRNFVHKDNGIMKYLEFCHKLAWPFIDNELTKDESKMERLTKRVGEQSDNHTPAPQFVKYFNGRVWILGSAQMYHTYKCKGENCQNLTHHICSNNRAYWFCPSCYVKLCLDCNITA